MPDRPSKYMPDRLAGCGDHWKTIVVYKGGQGRFSYAARLLEGIPYG